MSTHEIELTIERIVLHDLPAVPRQRLVSAVEDALSGLMTGLDLPPGLAVESISLPAASIEVAPDASIETMAGQIARAIMASLRPSMAVGSFGAAALSGPRAPGTPGWSQQQEGNHA